MHVGVGLNHLQSFGGFIRDLIPDFIRDEWLLIFEYSVGELTPLRGDRDK